MEQCYKRVLLLAAALLWLAASVTACAVGSEEAVRPGPDPDIGVTAPPVADSRGMENMVGEFASRRERVELEELKLLAVEKKEKNGDTVGWLRVPGTDIDDVIVFYPDDANEYYLKRDFERRPNQYGTYFIDHRWKAGEDYLRQGLSTNTCIYGHSMDDNPDGWAFSQLKRYLEPDFARENPVVYFSTLGEDMAWEVFAVFYATTEWGFNLPEWPNFQAMLQDCLDRSLYRYDVEVTPEDKILTLSTCCYNYEKSYPNQYRFVVMARLLQPGQTVETASFSINPTPKGPGL